MPPQREQTPWESRLDGQPRLSSPTTATAPLQSADDRAGGGAALQTDSAASAGGGEPSDATAKHAFTPTAPPQGGSSESERSANRRRPIPDDASPGEQRPIPQNVVSHDLGHLRSGMSVGRYQLGKLLGQGSMGTVYAGFDPKLERPVALKLLPAQPSQRMRNRLEREARALARLSHANVVRVYDAGVHEHRVFIAMELIAGQSVKAWCQSQPAPGWRQVLRVYLDAARGIAAAHASGLIHRDIKPANLLIGTDGRVRVADFGLAAVRAHSEDGRESTDSAAWQNAISSPSSGLQVGLNDRLTNTGAILGTPAFMAPEQHLGEDVGPAADQYSFCVALYEGLYGTTPFRSQNRAQPDQNGRTALAALCQRKLHGPTKPPQACAGHIPARLYQVIARGLAPAPGDRYPSMEALIAALEPVLRRRPGMRRFAVPSLVAGLASAVLAITVGLYWHRQASTACRDASAALVGIWDPARKAQVQTAFGATGLGYAVDTFARVEAVLDSYAQSWVLMRTKACAATRVHATQSEAVMDLRMYCLERRRQKLAALTEQYARGPDRDLVPKAVAAAQALPPIAHCGDVDALSRNGLPPPDPTTRTRIEKLYPRVYQLEALYEAGKYRDGLVLGEALLAEIADLDYAPLGARALLGVARLQQGAGDYTGAEVRLRAAIDMATRAHNAALLANAWTYLMENLGSLQNRYQEALDLRPSMNAAVERADDDLIRAQALNSTGFVLAESGVYEDARNLFQRAAVLWEQSLGPSHPAVAEALANLGLVLEKLGQYEQAIDIQTRAKSINENALGPEHPEVAIALSNLAAVLNEMGRNEAALDMYERALRIDEKALGPEHPIVATVLNNMGVVLMRMGRYKEAKACHQRALRIRMKTLGPKHIDVSGSLGNLAAVLEYTGQYDAAKSIYERILSTWEPILGSANPRIAIWLNNLAGVLERLGAYEQAKTIHERALAIREQTLGSEHVAVARSLNNLAVVLERLGRYRAAKDVHERALDIGKKVLGPENSYVALFYGNLAMVLKRLGHYEKAREKLEHAVALSERTLGAEHAQVAGLLSNLATVSYEMGHYKQAQTLLERALAIGDTALGPTHPRLAVFLSRLGRTLARRKDLAAAERYVARAEDILNQASPPRHASIARMLLSRGEVAMARNQPSNAAVLLERALDLDGVPPDLRVEIQYTLARALWATGEYRKRALALAKEAQNRYQRIGNRPMEAKVRRWLAGHQPRLRQEQ